MAPLPPSTTTTTTYYSHPRSLRRKQDERAGGARKSPPPPPHRSSSFHGRTAASPVEHRQMRRPKTQPDLLAGAERGMAASPEEKRLGKGGDKSFEAERRMPAKVLVNVTVQRSLGPVQVMASTEWTVRELVAAALRQYVKEGRRPLLPSAEPAAFGLHYSQFSLEPLDLKEKLIRLGSRNFFLCSKTAPATSDAATASSSSSSSSSSSCAKEAQKASKISITWLRFMDFLL
ncbi:uncharacterized protein At4g22758-like [Phoenix dactylifera]|uniref:Uncharacterized protein At4g22758-like n=1 Tax=Phoenix dactylifera TaxID=42345 RepID=A0A8B7CVT9_PHODC|nr:uncharacterized protein At4g22758-like [Phoenix dactylifera]